MSDLVFPVQKESSPDADFWTDPGGSWQDLFGGFDLMMSGQQGEEGRL
jgi:endo-1,4-beta-mannosidase